MLFSRFIKTFAASAEVLRPDDGRLQVAEIEVESVGDMNGFDRACRFMDLVDVADFAGDGE